MSRGGLVSWAIVVAVASFAAQTSAASDGSRSPQAIAEQSKPDGGKTDGKKPDGKPDGKKPDGKPDAKPDEKKGDADGWTTNFEEALKTAKKEKKAVMADFTGKAWCPHCIDLRKNVFETADFKAWAKKNVVLVELDFPQKDNPQLPPELAKQNEELKKKNNVGGYPTIVFFDATGKAMSEKMVGYDKDSAADWIKKADKILGIKK